MLSCNCLSLVALFASLLVFARSEETQNIDTEASKWEIGDFVLVECMFYQTWEPFEQKSDNAESIKVPKWGPGPVCAETNTPLRFRYGMDEFNFCSWHVEDQPQLDRLSRLIDQKEAWQCRVPMSPSKAHHIPFSIPIWGLRKGDRLHIDTHMNWIFHVDQGRIIGSTVYPLRDKFQYIHVGSKLAVHGPVRWFNKHTFQPLGAGDEIAMMPVETNDTVTLLWCLLTFGISFLLFVILYMHMLKPRAIRAALKKD